MPVISMNVEPDWITNFMGSRETKRVLEHLLLELMDVTAKAAGEKDTSGVCVDYPLLFRGPHSPLFRVDVKFTHSEDSDRGFNLSANETKRLGDSIAAIIRYHQSFWNEERTEVWILPQGGGYPYYVDTEHPDVAKLCDMNRLTLAELGPPRAADDPPRYTEPTH